MPPSSTIDTFALRYPAWVCAFLLLCVVTAVPASADQIVLKSGRTLTGEVAAEDDRTVTLEITLPGITFTQRVNKAQISSWNRPAQVGPPYVLIPIVGVIGTESTAVTLKKALDAARDARPKYIVLVIDSPGGQVGEMLKMIELLDGASKDAQVIAYVQSAYSAAAVLAMSCHQIYMTKNAMIGAAVPYRQTNNGPADIEAKFRSPIEAAFRGAAALGGHSELLMRGMTELDLQINLTQEDGKPVLSTSGPGKVIKSSGHILTLTASEAFECGLANIAADISDVGKQLAGGPWHEASRRAWNLVAAINEQQRRQAARSQVVEQIKPEWNAIERQIAELAAKYDAAQKTIGQLNVAYRIELRNIGAEYSQAMDAAKLQDDSKAAAARAMEVKNSRAAEARQSLQSNAKTLAADAEAARLQVEQLRTRQQQLLAAIPYE